MAVSPAAHEFALWVSLSPLRLLFAGHAAVGVFFVLSGFVLAMSLRGSSQGGYLPFVIRRFFRIWVPFAAAILFAALLVYLIVPQPIPGHAWINDSWSQPLTWKLVAGHLLMLGPAEYVTLDNPMWSLVHELRISLAFPLLAGAATLAPRLTLAGTAAAFALLSVTRLTDPLIGAIDGGLGRDLLFSAMQSVRYLFFFTLGVLLAQQWSGIHGVLERFSRLRPILWLIAFALLWVPYTKGYIELCYAAGAFLLLALCIHSPASRKLLRHPVLSWLGRISYSLYLVHLLVLLALLHWFSGRAPMAAILPAAVMLSLLLAWVANRYVEIPSNTLGKRIALKVSASR
jgi:peptidoglycan/LPS O-acetylase OafA/YrhL